MKVLVTEPIADLAIEVLQQWAETDTNWDLSPGQLQSIIPQYDALIVRSQTKVTSEIIEAAGNLRVIGRAGVGVDNIDVEAATRRGIIVVNSPEGNIVSTAEYTIAMLLALVRHIPEADNQLRAGAWVRELRGFEIRNKTIGIIGLGRVGTEVAQMAKCLRMHVIACDPVVTEERAERLGVRLVKMETLLKAADFITIHVPLNTMTKGLIGRQELKLMKPTAMLVNCARGGLIDEEALYEALDQDLLAGAAIDVFTEEPAQDNILWKSRKTIVTSHLAASTVEAEISSSRDVAEQVAAVLQGYPPRSPVNAPMISAEDIAVLGPYLEAGRIIGQIVMQVAVGQLQSLTIRYQGDLAKEDTNPVKVSVLRGLLEMMTDERVNMVNADMIANSRGIRVAEQKDATCENYTNMVMAEVATSSGRTLVGASSRRGRIYLTRVNDYWLEIEPSTHYILFTEHKDRPGMIGAVGTIIGDAGINISQMQVSLGLQRGGKAMMVLCLDEQPPEEIYQQILAIPEMYRAVIVKLANIVL